MVFLLNFLNCCSDSFVRRRPFILLSLYTCTLGHFSYWTESFFLSHRALAWDQLNWYTVISQWWHCYGDDFFFFGLYSDWGGEGSWMVHLYFGIDTWIIESINCKLHSSHPPTMLESALTCLICIVFFTSSCCFRAYLSQPFFLGSCLIYLNRVFFFFSLWHTVFRSKRETVWWEGISWFFHCKF